MNLIEILLIIIICLIFVIYRMKKKNNDLLLDQKSKETSEKQNTRNKSRYEKQKENKLVTQASIIKSFEVIPGDEEFYNTYDKTEIISKKESLFLSLQAGKGWELIDVKHLNKNKRQYYFKRLFYPDS